MTRLWFFRRQQFLFITRYYNLSYLKTYLIDASDNSPHGGITRSINSSSIVGRSPRGRVDVNEVGFMTHWVGLNKVSHVGLVQHSDSSHHGVVGHAHAANTVITVPWHLSGAPSAVAVKPVVGVARIGVRVIAAEVVACPGVLMKRNLMRPSICFQAFFYFWDCQEPDHKSGTIEESQKMSETIQNKSYGISARQ